MTLPIVTLNGTEFYKHGDRLYPAYLNKGNAVSFVEHVAAKFCKGNGIDIGAGEYPLRGAQAVELKEGRDGTDLYWLPNNALDYVFSSHCLEHIQDTQAALNLWVSKLKLGGTIFLYLPHPNMELWRPGGLWVGDGHKHALHPQKVVMSLYDAGAGEIGRDDGPDAYWSFWVAARRIK